MAEITHDNKSGKTYNQLTEQFAKPYQYYNPDFNFYDVNQVTMIDEKWETVNVLEDNNISDAWEFENARIQLENRLRDRVKAFIDRYEKNFHPSWIQAEKDYQLDTTARKIFLERLNKSFLTNEKMPIVRTKVDKVATWLYTQKYTVKVNAPRESNKKHIDAVQSYVEWWFSAANTRRAIIDASLDAVKYWTGIVRSWFRTINEETVQKNTWHRWFEPDFVYPYAKQVDPFCIYWDITQDFYSTDIIYRDFFSLPHIEKEKAEYFELSDNQRSLILSHPKPFSNTNHKKVRLIKWLWSDYENVLENSFDFFDENGWVSDFSLLSDSQFYQVNLNQDVCEYVEYWSGDNLVIAINGYIVYDYKNPLPTNRHPFHVINYTSSPWVWIWDGIGTMLQWMQRLYDIMFNAMYDMAKMKAWPMFKKKPWQSFEWMDEVFRREPRGFINIKWDPDLETVETPNPSEVNFAMMNDIMNMIDFAVSPTSYNELQWVSRSATDSEYRFQSLRDALKPLSEHVNDMIWHLVDDWLLMWKEYLPETMRVMIKSENKKKNEYQTITREALAGNYIFETEFDSLKDVNRSLERSQASEFLNSLNMVMKDPVDWRVLVNMEEVLTYITSLYSKNNDFSLSEKEFYDQLKRSQEKMSEIQQSASVWQEQASQPIVWEEATQLDQRAWASWSPVASETGWVPQISELMKWLRE